MVEPKDFSGGLDLKFFPDLDFESIESVASELLPPIFGRNALRLLMLGWPAKAWTQMLSRPILKAIFVQRDPQLLKELRYAFQQGFETVIKQLQGKQLTNEENEQVQLYLSNCLSLLPYSDLTPYESIKLPQFIDGQWMSVEYCVNPIELTRGVDKKNHDEDRVFAYGLEPIINEKAQSHLIFMGTTYPAGQGFVPQIYTDFEASKTVGSSLYLSGRSKIKEWLESQKNKVHVCGVSLGGSLSLLLAIDMGDFLSRVDALNPAGLYEHANKNIYDKWDELQAKPKVVIQKQADDPVSLFGVWKREWELLQVTPPANKRGPNAFFDHFLNYAGFAETKFTYLSIDDENSKRTVRDFWIYNLVRSLIYYSCIYPVTSLIRPKTNFFGDRKKVSISGILIAITATSLSALTVLHVLL